MNAHPSSLSDRELLELAAKAAGIRTVTRQYCDLLGVAVKEPGTWVIGRWNPLEDDGAALRLAVKLGMSVETNPYDGGSVRASIFAIGTTVELLKTDSTEERAVATRRAIVRAAAALAK